MRSARLMRVRLSDHRVALTAASARASAATHVARAAAWQRLRKSPPNRAKRAPRLDQKPRGHRQGISLAGQEQRWRARTGTIPGYDRQERQRPPGRIVPAAAPRRADHPHAPRHDRRPRCRPRGQPRAFKTNEPAVRRARVHAGSHDQPRNPRPRHPRAPAVPAGVSMPGVSGSAEWFCAWREAGRAET